MAAGHDRAAAADTDSPVGRKRDRDATRAALFGAAKLRFAADGYNHTSIRNIAADVGVNQALVYRYFGSKEQLFDEVAGADHMSRHVMEGPLEELPERVLQEVLALPTGNDGPDPLLVFLRSTDHEEARERLRNMLRRDFTEGLATRLDGPNARARAELVAALIMGSSLLRAVVQTGEMSDPELETAREPLRRAVRSLLEDPSIGDVQQHDPDPG